LPPYQEYEEGNWSTVLENQAGVGGEDTEKDWEEVIIFNQI